MSGFLKGQRAEIKRNEAKQRIFAFYSCPGKVVVNQGNLTRVICEIIFTG
jgi:hypothetical protein